MRMVSLVGCVVLAAACARSHVEPERDVGWDHEAAGDGEHRAAGRGGSRGSVDGNGSPGAPNPSAGDPASDNPLQAGAGGSFSALPDAAVPATGGAGSAGSAEDEPPSASEPTQVWIGQLWSIAPLLCDPNAPWSDSALVLQPMGYAERVVLIVDQRDDPAHPSGVISFGEGELPAQPEIPPNGSGDSGSFWLCSNQIPSRGGEYTVLDARRSNDRLSFEIEPSEIWDASCPDGDASCHCENTLCGTTPGERRVLDFQVTGDEMQTTFLAAGFGTEGELRLRRVQ